MHCQSAPNFDPRQRRWLRDLRCVFQREAGGLPARTLSLSRADVGSVGRADVQKTTVAALLSAPTNAGYPTKLAAAPTPTKTQ